MEEVDVVLKLFNAKAPDALNGAVQHLRLLLLNYLYFPILFIIILKIVAEEVAVEADCCYVRDRMRF